MSWTMHNSWAYLRFWFEQDLTEPKFLNKQKNVFLIISFKYMNELRPTLNRLSGTFGQLGLITALVWHIKFVVSVKDILGPHQPMDYGVFMWSSWLTFLFTSYYWKGNEMWILVYEKTSSIFWSVSPIDYTWTRFINNYSSPIAL